MNPVKHNIYALFVLLCVALLPFGSAAAFEIRPNCDLRKLNLSNQQKDTLHDLRGQLKKNLAEQSRNRSSKAQDVSLRTLLNKPSFDPQYARRIAEERFADEQLQAYLELNFYYNLYRILDSRQRQVWLDLCVR